LNIIEAYAFVYLFIDIAILKPRNEYKIFFYQALYTYESRTKYKNGDKYISLLGSERKRAIK